MVFDLAKDSSRRRRSRLTAAIATLASMALTVGALSVPTISQADTAPVDPRDPRTPSTVAADVLPTPQIGTGASQGLNDTEGAGVVYDQLVIGNTVYVGGVFKHARPFGAGANQGVVDRSNFLAYDIRTGELLDYAPAFNQKVYRLAASPDEKTLYVAGAFDTVDGQRAKSIAAFDVETGKRITAFAPEPNSQVKAIAVSDSTVYISGYFGAVNGVARYGLAGLDRRTGALTAWEPKVDREGRPAQDANKPTVETIQLSPTGDRVLLGGGFLRLNGSSNPGFGMGIVRPDTGTSLQNNGTPFPWKGNSVIKNGRSSSSGNWQYLSTISDFASDGQSVYGTSIGIADGTTFEGMFKLSWADGSVEWIADCHGDTYSIAPHGDAVYAAGHSHDCIGMGGYGEYVGKDGGWHRGVALSSKATGTLKPWTNKPVGLWYENHGGQPSPSLLQWYPDFNTGLFTGLGQGPWDVTASGDYVLFGGEFTSINGVKQRGLARFAVRDKAANTEGPRFEDVPQFDPVTRQQINPPAKPNDGSPALEGWNGTGVKLSWPAYYDRDNAALTYQVIRDGDGSRTIFETTVESSFWNRPTIRTVDTGLTPGVTYTYRIRAVDPTGREITGAPATYKALPGPADTHSPGTAVFWRSDSGNTALPQVPPGSTPIGWQSYLAPNGVVWAGGVQRLGGISAAVAEVGPGDVIGVSAVATDGTALFWRSDGSASVRTNVPAKSTPIGWDTFLAPNGQIYVGNTLRFGGVAKAVSESNGSAVGVTWTDTSGAAYFWRSDGAAVARTNVPAKSTPIGWDTFLAPNGQIYVGNTLRFGGVAKADAEVIGSSGVVGVTWINTSGAAYFWRSDGSASAQTDVPLKSTPIGWNTFLDASGRIWSANAPHFHRGITAAVAEINQGGAVGITETAGPKNG